MRPLLHLRYGLLLIALLTACAIQPTTSRSTASPEPGAQRPVSVVTLTLWHSWSGAKRDALNTIARSYEQAFPDVRIRLEEQPAPSIIRQYSNSVADGSAPQLLLMPGRYIGELAERQYVAPLDEALLAEPLSKLLSQAVASARIDGKLYAVPLTFDTLVLFYDRRRVAAPPETIADAINLNQEQRDQPPEQRPWSLCYYLSLENTLPYLSAFGGRVLGPDGEPVFASTDRDATQRWLSWLQGLQKNEHVLASLDFSTVDAQVQSGRVLSVIDWSQRRTTYAQVWGNDAVGVAALPLIAPEQAPQPLVLSEMIAVNPVASAEQRAAAANFLAYLVSNESQQTLLERGRLLPVHEAAAAAEPFWPIVQSAQPLMGSITTTGVWRPMNDMFRSVVSNAATANEALDSVSLLLQKPAP